MKATIELSETQENEIVSLSGSLINESRQFEIVKDDPTRDLALEFGKRISKMRTLVSNLFDDPIADAHKLHKSLCNRRKGLDDPLAEAATNVSRGVGNYEAKKRAELEAQRQVELERQRRELAEIEAKRRHDEEISRRKIEEERIAQALKLEAEGKKKQAEAVIAAPIYVPPPAPIPVTVTAIATPKYQAPEGTTIRLNWKFEIVDANSIPREFMTPNENAIGAFVRSQKEKAQIPGVRVYSEASTIIR